MSIELDGVTVVAAGHEILRGVDLTVPSGAHVAIVGRSGAGKSTLLGLLLGWHVPTVGEVRADGRRVAGERLARLRDETAWVDPAVQLWNRPLVDNLRYGAPGNPPSVTAVVRLAGLEQVLASLAHDGATALGEGGALVSGGEGQRVRFGRALARSGSRLVLLDEPFRGLDRVTRTRLVDEVRRQWPDATILCATHDVASTQAFDRVLVMEAGHVVEDGLPDVLSADPSSRYFAMLQAEAAARRLLFDDDGWRRLQLAGGRLSER